MKLHLLRNGVDYHITQQVIRPPVNRLNAQGVERIHEPIAKTPRVTFTGVEFDSVVVTEQNVVAEEIVGARPILFRFHGIAITADPVVGNDMTKTEYGDAIVVGMQTGIVAVDMRP